MKCLILGASGQVGGQLALRCQADGLGWLGTAFQRPRFGLRLLDLRDAMAVADVVHEFRPDVVFLPAAMTHVDRAEEYADECRAINIGGARHVANALRESGHLVYFSTEHVFAETVSPCREDAPIAPVSVYAKSKAEAEQLIREILPDRHLILRTSWVFGPEEQGKNFVYRAVRTLRAGQPLVVPDDQFGQPTYSPDLARTAVQLARSGFCGTFHVAGPVHLTRLEFARLIATTFGLDSGRIIGKATAELAQAAPRPLRVCLSDEKIKAALGRSPIRHPNDALLAMRDVLVNEQKSIPDVA